MKVKILLHSNLVRETSRSVENVNITLAQEEGADNTPTSQCTRQTHTRHQDSSTRPGNEDEDDEKVALLAAQQIIVFCIRTSFASPYALFIH